MKTIKVTHWREVPDRMSAISEYVNSLLTGGQVEVEIKRPGKSRATEKKYHCLINDKHSRERSDSAGVDGYVHGALAIQRGKNK